MKKITCIGTIIMVCFILSLSLSTAYAAKAESIYFYAPDGEWMIEGAQIIYNDDGTPAIAQFQLSGTMKTGVFFEPTLGTFTCVETAKFVYDKSGLLKYSVRNAIMVISNDDGTITISFKFKLVSGVPNDFMKPGSWVITEGTGDYAEASGKGEYLFPFKFYGDVRNFP